MKFFAFLLASLFIMQASTPALCMTECLFELVVSCESSEESSCCAMEQKTSCRTAEELKTSVFSERNGITEHTYADFPCNNCGVPCCSAPLCCCYFQNAIEIDFSVRAASFSGQLPSNNGIPVSGYLDECFQPPETI